MVTCRKSKMKLTPMKTNISCRKKNDQERKRREKRRRIVASFSEGNKQNGYTSNAESCESKNLLRSANIDILVCIKASTNL